MIRIMVGLENLSTIEIKELEKAYGTNNFEFIKLLIKQLKFVEDIMKEEEIELNNLNTVGDLEKIWAH